MNRAKRKGEPGRSRGSAWRLGLAAISTGLLAAACSDSMPTSPATAAPEEVRAARAASIYSFQTIEVDGARLTAAWGINAGGEIVGYYVDSDYVYHGFLWRDGTFTSIDYPGAAGTDVRGIGPGGEIVGTYWLAGEPGVANHAFRMSKKGEFTAVSYPGHTYMIAQRVLPDGAILGCRHDTDFSSTMRGVTMSKKGNEEVSLYASMNNGATPDLKHVVGMYRNQAANRTEAYTIDNGVITPFFFAGSTMTNAWDVNASGQIVGVYQNGSGSHGYVLTNRDFANVVTLDVPGASATRAFGINSRGDVVGSFTVAGKTYGFLARAGR
ncbi:MAG: hypothetical protein ACSLFK_16800 [Gemmatimonadaceae bacterium]